MVTFGTLFSGGELAGIGMQAAGLTHRWGIEIRDDIAQVARNNGFNVITADVLQVDPATMEPVDCLHASPVCVNASNANQSAKRDEKGSKETDLDRAFGQKIAQFIDVMKPRVFTLENVYKYRDFDAFGYVPAALNRGGYMWDFDNLNSANFSVPQTRRRLVLRAIRGALLPNLPQPEQWVGWYEAIEDIIHTLPESKFAKWQLERLPKELLQSGVMVDSRNVTQQYGKLHRLANEPAITVTVTDRPSHFPKAFVLGSQYGQPMGTENRSAQMRLGNEPYFSVTVSGGKHGDARAWLVSSIDSTVRRDSEPANTVVAVGDGHSVVPRAWLIAQGGYDGNIVHRADNEPSFTVTANNNQQNGVRGWLSTGRVVAMTPRALARFQSLPDSYLLPPNNKLACTIIGNGVPSLLMQKIYQGLVRV